MMFVCGLAVALCAVSPPDSWVQFRGTGDSVSDATDLPTQWSDSENVAWRAPLAGFGQSSPIVYKGKVFVTSVEGEFKDTLILESFDLKSGQSQWKRTFQGTQQIKNSGYVSKAAPTPAVDADRVYALFESGDVVAVDHDGNPIWQRSLVNEYGKIQGAHGLGSSVVLADNKVILLVDHDGPSYLLACDPATGNNAWKTDRAPGVSWSTPTAVNHDGKTRLVVSAHDGAQAYDAATGQEVWTFTGLNGNNVPSPTPAGDNVLIGSDKAGANVAIRLGGSGDVTASHLAWTNEKVSTTFCSVLLDKGRGYYVNRAGVCFCLNADNGELLWNERLAASCWASPVSADGHLYFFSKNGTTTVLKASQTFENIAENNISLEGEDRVYGVAFVQAAIVLRLERQLICLSSSRRP